MVCSLGSGRMAVMARLLTAGSLSQTMADEIGHQKSAAGYICRELREADEANLLDEEDMHVYGLRPMTDPLNLVCCNACKKPIQASQYAAHAELCRSLKFTEQTILELDGGSGNRKPPRKEKKKLSTSASRPSAVGERERSESKDTVDTAALQSHLDNQIRVTSSSNEAKGHFTSVDAASMMDGTGINPGNREHPASIMHPPRKRHKLTPHAHLPLSENAETVSEMTKTACFLDGVICRDRDFNMLERAVSDCMDRNDCLSDHRVLGPVHEQNHTRQGQPLSYNWWRKGFPEPLATKIYYSQRSNRLRAALSDLYFQDSRKEFRTDVACPKLSNEMIALQDSSQRNPSLEHEDNVLEDNSHMQSLCSDQIFAKSSEICMNNVGGQPSGLSSQFLVDNLSKPAATPVGLNRSNFLPNPFSFASNAGNPLGAIQQPNGSVPVI